MQCKVIYLVFLVTGSIRWSEIRARTIKHASSTAPLLILDCMMHHLLKCAPRIKNQVNLLCQMKQSNQEVGRTISDSPTSNIPTRISSIQEELEAVFNNHLQCTWDNNILQITFTKKLSILVGKSSVIKC